MSKEQRKDWEKARAKGFGWYVISRTLLCGFGLSILMIILNYIFDGTLKAEKLGWRIIGYSIAGLIFSWYSCEWNEYRYKQTAGKKD